MPIWKRHPGFIYGSIFTLLVAGLLVYLHSQDVQHDEVVPGKEVIDEVTDKAPGLWACADAPYCSGEMLARVANRWEELGYEVVELGGGECPDVCTFLLEDVAVELPCKKGWTSITLADAWSSASHNGRTYMPVDDGDVVITLSAVIEAGDPTAGVEQAPLPEDIEELICAHEVGHSFNIGHEYTPVGGTGVVARKEGQMMHPDTVKLGWGDAGLERE